ncbi:glycosyltransferase [Priestia megaterium]|uniref:glycosyltransferase n=1 Tax=Priestia megaterium TaxID=1404 RepID=UPI00300803EA
MKMKKIVFMIGVLSNGGAERVISILAKELCDIGYEVSIITLYGDKNDYLLDERINIYPMSHVYSNKVVRFFELTYKTRKLMKKINPDVIISFVAIINIYTIISTAFLKNKLIVSERNDPYQNPENSNLRKLRDFLYRFSDGFVFQTNDAKKYFNGIIQDKGTIIPNPVKTELPLWNESKESKTIITACRLSRQKNLPMLIQAFSEVKKTFPEYKLKIFGIGELQNELSALIEEKGLKGDVLLPGFSNDIHNEMANSSLFVLSSNYEGISNSMLEALAIGIPVVSTDSPIGGARMFIRSGENGILTDVGNTKQLEKAMTKILLDKEFAIRLSLKSRELRKELSQEKIINMWINYINDICGGNDAISKSTKD